MSSMFTVYAGKANDVVNPAKPIQTTTTMTFKEYPAIRTKTPVLMAPVGGEALA